MINKRKTRQEGGQRRAKPSEKKPKVIPIRNSRYTAKAKCINGEVLNIECARGTESASIRLLGSHAGEKNVNHNMLSPDCYVVRLDKGHRGSKLYETVNLSK